MIIDLITKRRLSHILAIILALEDYPQERIDAFCQAFIDAATLNGTPDYMAMATALEAVLDPFHDTRTTTNIDRKTKTKDIKLIKANEDFVIAGLKDLETKINVLTGNDQTVIEELSLNVKSLFYSGNETDRVLNFEQLLKAIKLNPLLPSLVTQTVTFTTACCTLYDNKTVINTSITSDVSDKKTLIDPIKDVMFKNYLTTCGYNIANLTKVGDYFRTILMDPKTNLSDFLYKYQYMVLVAAGMFINDPRVAFKFDYYLKAENLGLGDCMVFLSDVPNPTTIPGRAVLVKAGETIEFPFKNIGSATELYLIFVAVTPGVDVKLKVTSKAKK